MVRMAAKRGTSAIHAGRRDAGRAAPVVRGAPDAHLHLRRRDSDAALRPQGRLRGAREIRSDRGGPRQRIPRGALRWKALQVDGVDLGRGRRRAGPPGHRRERAAPAHSGPGRTAGKHRLNRFFLGCMDSSLFGPGAAGPSRIPHDAAADRRSWTLDARHQRNDGRQSRRARPRHQPGHTDLGSDPVAEVWAVQRHDVRRAQLRRHAELPALEPGRQSPRPDSDDGGRARQGGRVRRRIHPGLHGGDRPRRLRHERNDGAARTRPRPDRHVRADGGRRPLESPPRHRGGVGEHRRSDGRRGGRKRSKRR